MANNFAGLRTSAGPKIIRFLLKETDETLYQLILSILGPSGQAIVQNIFKCAIELGDIRIVKLFLQKKAAEIGLDQLFCFEVREKIATPIEQAVRLRHHNVVELLLSYNVDVNRTYPEDRLSHGGALACTLDYYDPGRGDKIDIDPRLFNMLLNAGGKLSPENLSHLIRSSHSNLSFPVLLRGTRRSFAQWSEHGIFHVAISCLEERFLTNLVDLMVELGVDLNHYSDEYWSGQRREDTMIDLAARNGKLDLVKKLYEKKASLTDNILPYGIASGNEDLIRFLLLDLEMDPHRSGRLTPFAAAITLQKPWLTEFLIDHDAMSLMANRGDAICALEAAWDVGDDEMLENITKEVTDSLTLGIALGSAIEGEMDALAFQLLDAGADISFGDALVEALKRRNQSLILALLDADALTIFDKDTEKDSRENCSTFPKKLWQLAVEWGDRFVIQALIDAGADVNKTSNALTSPLPLNAAIQENNVELLEIFLQAGADINHPVSRQIDKTALSDAVLAGNIDLVARLLDYGADPQDDHALKEAMKFEDDDFIELILESYNKRYPRGRKGFGSEALKIAIDADDMKRTTKLLRKNADCNSLEEYSKSLTAFGHAICSAKGDRDNFVELFLQEGRSNPNGVAHLDRGICLSGLSYDHKVTAFLAAVKKGTTSTVRLLIKHGANVNLPSRGGIRHTPLQAAAKIGNIEIVQLLLNHGADVNGSAAPRGGGTALQFAAAGGYASLVCKLLGHGAEVDGPGSKVDGMTAMEAAAKYGRLDTVQILLNAGAASDLETRQQITNAITLANDQGHLAVSRLLEDHARTSGMSEVLQDGSDVEDSDFDDSDVEDSDFDDSDFDNSDVNLLSDEENGHEAADHGSNLNDRSEDMYVEEFHGDEPLMNEDDIFHSAQSYQPRTDFRGWNDGLPDSAVPNHPFQLPVSNSQQASRQAFPANAQNLYSNRSWPGLTTSAPLGSPI